MKKSLSILLAALLIAASIAPGAQAMTLKDFIRGDFSEVTQKLDEEIAELKRALDEKTSSNALLASQKRIAELRSARLSRQVSELTGRVASLTSELSYVQSQLDVTNAAYLDNFNELQQARSDLSYARRRVSTITSKYNSLLRVQSDLELARQRISELENMIQNNSVNNSLVQYLLRLLNDRTSELTSVQTQLSGANAAITTLNSQIDTLTREYNAAQQLIFELRKQLEDKKSDSALVASLNAQVQTLTASLSAANARIAELEKDTTAGELRTALGQANATIDELRGQIATLNTTAETRDATIAELQKRVSELETENAALKAGASEPQDAPIVTDDTALKQANATIDELKGLLAAAESEADGYAKRVEELTAEIETLKNASESGDGRAAALESELQTLKQTAAGYEATIAELRGELEGVPALEGRISELEGLLASEQAASAEYQLQIAELQANMPDVSAYENEIATLEGQIAELQANMPDVAAYENEIATLEGQMAELQASLQTLTLDYQTFTQWYVELYRSLDTLRSGQEIPGVSVYTDEYTGQKVDPLKPPIEGIIPEN